MFLLGPGSLRYLVWAGSQLGLREQVGGVLGMLWRIRILRNVVFFVNCSESGVCGRVHGVSFGSCGVRSMHCSHRLVGLIVKALIQDFAP